MKWNYNGVEYDAVMCGCGGECCQKPIKPCLKGEVYVDGFHRGNFYFENSKDRKDVGIESVKRYYSSDRIQIKFVEY